MTAQFDVELINNEHRQFAGGGGGRGDRGGLPSNIYGPNKVFAARSFECLDLGHR